MGGIKGGGGVGGRRRSHAILSLLATDSLAKLRNTSPAVRTIVAGLPPWANHNLRVEDVYSSKRKFKSAIKRAITVPQWAVFKGGALEFASHVTSINLDREYLPVDVNLILPILDTFTSLRKASFVGCFESGMVFVYEATGGDRFSRWSKHLRLLDLSDGNARVVHVAKKRPRCTPSRDDEPLPDIAAWSEFDLYIPTALQVRRLVLDRGSTNASVEAYPRLCTSCEQAPSHLWDVDNTCLFCSNKPGPSVDCGKELTILGR
ncbi:hypothetical protein M427DRAFT_32296 [Gonapodya prolifera JEL478]|uniref:Uncharacterized protein n=1 Tax=Gonapodya prolifera (strain JEL478) TaxID=1344416 RepID=A0A139AFN6_GONPJ|nr:hypothetical protein M427DRAFT_32296 [Gonapodya prolifera JEL478]|eukprot:KXS15616.1 hypothetical protein M427DRAFT_32296 [Gonapodya prolifera JEL478]